MKNIIIIALVISVPAALLLIGLTISERRHQARLDRVTMFMQIGKKIASQLKLEREIPQTADDLRASGLLSSVEWEFFTNNRVAYMPPGRDSGGINVFLRMRHEGNVNLVVRLDGFMDKEYPSRND